MQIVGEKIDVASDPQVVGMQLAMVSATLPRSVDEFVAEVTPVSSSLSHQISVVQVCV